MSEPLRPSPGLAVICPAAGEYVIDEYHSRVHVSDEAHAPVAYSNAPFIQSCQLAFFDGGIVGGESLERSDHAGTYRRVQTA